MTVWNVWKQLLESMATTDFDHCDNAYRCQ